MSVEIKNEPLRGKMGKAQVVAIVRAIDYIREATAAGQAVMLAMPGERYAHETFDEQGDGKVREFEDKVPPRMVYVVKFDLPKQPNP